MDTQLEVPLAQQLHLCMSTIPAIRCPAIFFANNFLGLAENYRQSARCLCAPILARFLKKTALFVSQIDL
jgi:hypothetical protein